MKTISEMNSRDAYKVIGQWFSFVLFYRRKVVHMLGCSYHIIIYDLQETSLRNVAKDVRRRRQISSSISGFLHLFLAQLPRDWS